MQKGSTMKTTLADRSGRALRAAVELQMLEARQLFAAFASLTSAGTLNVVGDANANQISFDLSGESIIARRDGQSISFDAAKVKRFWANGFGGNDKITVNVAKPATLIGGSGKDTLVGSKADDSMEGNSGNDKLISRGGNDRYNFGGDAGDVL